MAGHSASNDAELITRIIQGDDAAFDAMIVKYYSDLLTYMSYAAGSQDVGEDLLQELFLQVWRGRTNLPLDGNLRLYLYTAARHRVLDYFRTQRRTESRVTRYAREYVSHVSIPQDFDTPLTELEQGELANAVQSAIASLPERASEVWRLHREEGLSYQEIAHVLGISVNTVKTHMARAAAAIRVAAGPFLLFYLIVSPI